jgi:hypothetical protein
MNFIQKFFASQFLKGILDKIPGNGFKTFLGVLLIALGELGKLYPSYGGIISWVVELIQPYANMIGDVGIGALIIGVIHKIAKFVQKD